MEKLKTRPDISCLSYRMPFGKYRGETMGVIRLNNLGYILWLSEQEGDTPTFWEAVAAAKKVLDYIEAVDPGELSTVKRLS